ncbi:MAG TPA: Hpt domain-containing protein [Bacteroidales bacterium]|nr:Hpt domain-containing protein [Bacteroidales bacterium]HRZ76585.1 Hpt domain-containing protein [Bacteroidales bacterium]
MKPTGRHHDLHKLSLMLDGDGGALAQMIRVFCESTPEIVEALNTAFREGDHDMLGRMAHKLKSSVDLFGIAELGASVRQIEQWSRLGEPMAGIAPLLSRLNGVVAEVMQDLQEDG